MALLSKQDRERIIKLLENGENLPSDYKHILFPPEKKEYELVYSGKQREEDILADSMAVPLQPIKAFGGNGNSWTNKLIFGDNLQVLKSLLDDLEVKRQVKLIYIDPPFSTKQEFRGSQDQKAYQDKIAGARFIEFLRKRLIILRELLADDGSIYVHLDYRSTHYIKILMDEIFGKNNFRNEVIWSYFVSGKYPNYFARNHENILVFSKTQNPIFNYRYYFDKCLYYEKYYENNIVQNPDGKEYYLYNGELRTFEKQQHETWTDIDKVKRDSKTEKTTYPTQKPEALLERIINASSNEGDLVLDAFAGSGTTLAVAEKLGRRWIGIDCGKLAIYTMQKRMLNLKSEAGNKGEKLETNPFTLYHAGLYDFSKLKKLAWVEWRKFALLLFNCRDDKHTVSGIELDGYRGRSDVLVFDHQKDGGVVLDYGFISDLHSMLVSKIGSQFFIIAPAASVTFLEDYIDKGSVRYYILRIPYSIINELHNNSFEAIKQPVDESQINDTVDAVGFDFIRQPKVECTYSVIKPEDQLQECAIVNIKTFKSEAMLKGASQLDNLKSLSMIMVDYDFDGEVFNLDSVFYASEIEKNGWKVLFPVENIKKQIMIIYLDIFGNEYREIKTPLDFRGEKEVKQGVN